MFVPRPVGITIRLLAFGGPRHVMTEDELGDSTFRAVLAGAVERMSQYYLRASDSLVLRAEWCEGGGLRLRQTSLLNGKPTVARTWSGSTLVPRRDDLAIATLRGVLDGSVAFGSIQDPPDCRGMSGEVLTNLLKVHLGLDDPARDPQCPYRAWNWFMLDAEMSDVLEESEPEGADWLWVTRTTEAAALMVRRYCSGDCEEHIWSPGAPCSLQSVQTWMEWESVSEFIAGRMSNGQVALVFATSEGSDQQWLFMALATGPRVNIAFSTLRGLVDYAPYCEDWPPRSPIRRWFEAFKESGLVV